MAADAIAELLTGLVDKRVERALPAVGLTWCWLEYLAGRYYAHVDTGQVVPSPATWWTITAVGSSKRYPCFWFQNGHDLLVLGDYTLADDPWVPDDMVDLIPSEEMVVSSTYEMVPWEGSAIGFSSMDGYVWETATPWPYGFTLHVRFQDDEIGGTRYARVTALPSGTWWERSAADTDNPDTQLDLNEVMPYGTTGIYVEVKSTEPGVTVVITTEEFGGDGTFLRV